MKQIKNSAVAVVGLFVVFFAVAALIPALTQGQKSNVAPPPPTFDVKVVNTTAEPVPVAGTVNVANAVANPIAVRDVDNPARQPVQINESYTVPEGKRLVIEYVSLELVATTQCELLITSLSASGVLLHVYRPKFVGTSVIGPGPTAYWYVASQETRAYVGQNRTVTLQIQRLAGCLPNIAHASATGYLVDM